MNENEDPDHVRLTMLLGQTKPILAPMSPGQLKIWVAESQLAHAISLMLVQHPEYYDEISAHVGGIFPKPKS
jgi:hypothetical protein